MTKTSLWIPAVFITIDGASQMKRIAYPPQRYMDLEVRIPMGISTAGQYSRYRRYRLCDLEINPLNGSQLCVYREILN